MIFIFQFFIDCETSFTFTSTGTNGSNQSNGNNTSYNTNMQQIYKFQLQIDNECNDNNRDNIKAPNHALDHGNNALDHKHPPTKSHNITLSCQKDNNSNTKSSKYDNITYISSKVRKNKTTAADRQAEAKDRSIWYTATPWQQFNAPKPSGPQLHAYF